MTERADWADPGYFAGESRIGNTVRVLVQLVRPPRGHRTLPTKTGMLLILITIGVGTAGFNTGQNILYLALAMLLSTLLVSGLLSWANFKGCRWRLDTGRHFRAGVISPVFLQLENTKRHLPSYSLTFQMQAELSGQHVSVPLQERLDPGHEAKLTWEFVPQKRGRETILLKGLVSRYPFGFLRKSISDSFQREVLVWPKRIPYEFSGRKAGKRWMYGHHRRRGDGVDIIQLRDYYHGDSMRRIHWKATARLGKLQVKETEQEHHQAFSIWVDLSASVWTDPIQFERMCSFAGSLAEDLYQRDQLRSAQVAGKPRINVGAIEDLHTFLYQLSEAELLSTDPDRRMKPDFSNVVRFLPGANGSVIARMGEVSIGTA